ncbi:MAG TPA: efflux RND transporter periplasmic adaptor subunit [Vicinamibacterales bacterium]|nr:efflux RND transporter periplasmic adaptor subunit [Vicinamibacterales bacterium]
MTVRRALAALVSGSALAIAACGGADAPPPQPGAASTASERPALDVARVEAHVLNSTVSLPGELTPFESVDVYAKETGFVKVIRVDRGSNVRRGDVLAELEAPELVAQHAQASAAYQSAQSQLSSAEARLASDRATAGRLREAARTPGVVAGNDVEVAQRTVDADTANVSALRNAAKAAREGMRAVEQREDYLTITAPFDGQVTTRFVHPGALVGPSAGGGAATPIVRIQNLTRDRLVVPVPEDHIAGVAAGTIVDFTVSAFPGRTFHAPIARISREVDPKTRTMPVELDVQDPHGELSPGVFCDVRWPVRRTYPTLFVPASSVATNLQRTFVVRVRDGRTAWVDVTTGTRAGASVEVFGDLAEGDLVAVRGSDQIQPAIDVRVRESRPGM